jgi:hypothetical protein
MVETMTEVRKLGSMHIAEDNLLGACYHQCTRCGVIFGCEVTRTANVCGNPFHYGKCKICNGTKTVSM